MSSRFMKKRERRFFCILHPLHALKWGRWCWVGGRGGGNFTLVFGTACKKVLFLSIQLITMQGWEATTPFFSLGLLSRLTSPPPRPSSAFPRVSRPSWLKILPFSFLFPLARLFFFFHRVLESWNDPTTRRGRPLFVRHIAGDLNSYYFGQLASNPRDCRSGRTKLGRGQCITPYSQEEVILEIFATHNRRLRS